MHKIRLGKGAEFEVTMCIVTQGILWIRFINCEMTASQIVSLFDDEENTTVIEEITDTSTSRHEGFMSIVQYTKNDFGTMIGLKHI